MNYWGVVSREKHAKADCVNAASQKVAPAMCMHLTVTLKIVNANVMLMQMSMPAPKVKRVSTEHAKVL